ncbi:MAG: YafY family transcriptional regulator [Bacteroidetes bacterium]|nr:YafY family transcriptional regulator [Bacteroidota bacterium]MBU1800368.1 YafY family transcriptional regulator [Bacteroidota bacterium]
MNRFNRVTAIWIQLQSKKVIKAKDIATRFNISIRTVYRDIQTLVEAGVPIGSEAGIGYYLIDGYRLPPVMFSKEEVTAFLTAEKLVERFTDNSMDSNFKSGMMKIRAILRNSEKELLESIEENIEVIRRKPYLKNLSNTNGIQILIESISERRSLNIRYHTFYSNEVKDRNIEPIGLFFSGNNWHTIAFCELRQDYRDFRLDRILNISKTEKIFKKKHPSIKDYLNKISDDQNLKTIVILVDKTIAQFLNEQKYYNGFVDEQEIGDSVQMTFLTSSPNYFLRWYLMFADKAEIVSPESLKIMLKEKILEIKKNNFKK